MSEYPTYLIHYGIPGQKWGIRRYQNEDGSLTPEGYEHYGREKGKYIERKNLYKQWKKSKGNGLYENELLKKQVYNDKKLMNIEEKRNKLNKKINPKYSELDIKKATEYDLDWADEMFNESTGEASYYTLSKYKQKKYKQIFEDLVKDEMRLSAIRNAKEDGTLETFNKLNEQRHKRIDKLANEILGEFKDKKVKFKTIKGRRVMSFYDNTMMYNTISVISSNKYK